MSTNELDLLDRIASLLKEAGYDPNSQLRGFVETGDDSYITRKGNARQLIKTINKNVIQEYIKQNSI